MDLYGWIQLALFLGLLLLVTRPMGVYLFRVLDPQGKTFLDPVLKPVERLFYRLMRDRPEGRAGLEAVRRFHAGVQPGGVALHLCHPAPAAPAAAQPAAPRPRERAPRLQHGGQLHHEHELAELRRGVHDVVPLPDGRPRLPQLRLRRRRHRRGRGARAGDRPAHRQDGGQLPGGPGPGDPVPAAPHLPRLRGLPGLPGDDPELQAV